MIHEQSKLKDRETLLKEFYRQMVLIRTVEETLLGLFSKGVLRGTVHTCLGQEASAVGVVNALDKSLDIICSNHRGHGHFLAYCEDIRGLILEVMGKEGGVCNGIGGSQHLQRSNFYSNGILGGMAPVATGMAFAEKQINSGAIVVVFLGDGAMAEGAVYEAFNMASLWKLPVLFAVEHNRYAQSTPWELQHSGFLERRGEPFGIPTHDIDGNDVRKVYDAACRSIHEIRAGKGPQILFMQTYRLGPHSKGDDLRDPAEIAYYQERQPIQLARQQLDPEWSNQIDNDIHAMVSEIVAEIELEGVN